jgi:hypothetical protein
MAKVPTRAQFRIITAVAAGITALVLLVGCARLGAPLVLALVIGTLIGAASVATRPGSAPAAYVAFGLLVGYAFCLAVATLREQVWFGLVLVGLLVVGGAWLLSEPGWPSSLFATASVAAVLTFWAVAYQNRWEFADDPAAVARSTSIAALVLGSALVFVALSQAEELARKARKARKASRGIRVPSSVEE